MGHNGTSEILTEIPFHEAWDRVVAVAFPRVGQVGFQVMLHDAVEHRLGGAATPVKGGPRGDRGALAAVGLRCGHGKPSGSWT